MTQSLIAAGAGLIGALIGGLTTLAVSRQSWNRTLVLEAIDDISRSVQIAWTDVDGSEAQRLEARVRFKLALLGAREEPVNALFAIIWQHRVAMFEGPDGPSGASSSEELLQRLDAAQRTLANELRGISRKRAISSGGSRTGA